MRATQAGLLPSLLDRLVDTASPDAWANTVSELREAVRRDLAHLFNATHLASVRALRSTPDVARSVLNFGIPELAGRTASSIDTVDLEDQLRRAVLTFEPRVLEDDLRIAVVSSQKGGANTMELEIEGSLWCEPVPVPLRLRAELSLEDGEVRFAEAE